MGKFEPDNLGGLYEQFAKRLTLYARQWLGDEQACDCVQQAFLKLMSHGKNVIDVRAWLFRSVRNAALDRIKTEQRRRSRESVFAARKCEWFEADPGNPLDAAEAREALAKLSDDMREIVIMKFWGGLSLRQIAEVTGNSATNVARMYYNALVRLKKILG